MLVLKCESDTAPAYNYLYREGKTKYLSEGNSIQGREEVRKLLHPSYLSRSVRYYVARLKVEVFTVFVDGINEWIYALCGTIIVDDGSDEFSIYKRDESTSELLLDHGLACIEVNYRAIQNSEFSMMLNLRDPVGNLEVSRGSVCWNVVLIEHGNMSMYEKRACCLVCGKDGFAAMHYTIFENVFEALVEVKLFANGDPINFYGSLTGSYTRYDYSTSYQKKYFKSRLFDRPRDKALELKSSSKIDLVKSIVVVPAEHSLIIEEDLGAFCVVDGVDKPMCWIKYFEIDLINEVIEIIEGKNYWIEVCVKFQK